MLDNVCLCSREFNLQLGIREMRGLAGTISGSPMFVDDVASLGRMAGLSPRLACALVGLTTGVVEYTAAGMDIIETKIGFPPGIGAAIASVIAGDRAEPGIVAARTLARALAVDSVEDIRLVVGCARQLDSNLGHASPLRQSAPKTGSVLAALALASLKAVDSFLDRHDTLFGQRDLKANIRCAVVLCSTCSLASFEDAFGVLLKSFFSSGCMALGNFSPDDSESCASASCIREIAERVGEAQKRVKDVIKTLCHSLEIAVPAAAATKKQPDDELIPVAAAPDHFEIAKEVGAGHRGSVCRAILSVIRLAAGQPLRRDELPWFFRRDDDGKESDADIRRYALVYVCSSSIGAADSLSGAASRAFVHGDDAVAEDRVAQAGAERGAGGSGSSADVVGLEEISARHVLTGAVAPAAAVPAGSPPATLYESFMTEWIETGRMPGEFCAMLLHEEISGDVGSSAVLEALWALVLLHKPRCDSVWHMRPLLTSINNPSAGTIACMRCLHALSHATPKSRSRLDSLHADFAVLARKLGVDLNALLIFVKSALGDPDAINKLARVLHHHTETIQIFMGAALDCSNSHGASVHPSLTSDRTSDESPESKLRRAFSETARGRGPALLRLGAWLYRDAEFDAPAKIDALAEPAFAAPGRAFDAPSQRCTLLGRLHELALGPTISATGSYSQEFLEAGLTQMCDALDLTAVCPLLRGMLQLSCGDTQGMDAASEIALLPNIYMHNKYLDDAWDNFGRGKFQGLWRLPDATDKNYGIDTPIRSDELCCCRTVTIKTRRGQKQAAPRRIAFFCHTCPTTDTYKTTDTDKPPIFCIPCARVGHVGHTLEAIYGDRASASACSCKLGKHVCPTVTSIPALKENPQFCVVQLILRVAAARAGCAMLETAAESAGDPAVARSTGFTAQLVKGLVHLAVGDEKERGSWEEAAEIVASLPILVRQEGMGQHVMGLVECLERRVPGGSGGLLATTALCTLRRLRRTTWRASGPSASVRTGGSADSAVADSSQPDTTSAERTCFKLLEARLGSPVPGLCAAYRNALFGCASADDVSTVCRAVSMDDVSAVKILGSIAFFAQTVTRWASGPGGTWSGRHPLLSPMSPEFESSNNVEEHLAVVCGMVRGDLANKKVQEGLRCALRVLVGDYARGIHDFVKATADPATAEWLLPWVDAMLQNYKHEGAGAGAAATAAAAGQHLRVSHVVNTIIVRALPSSFPSDDIAAAKARVMAIATAAHAATTGSLDQLGTSVRSLLGTRSPAVGIVVLGTLALAHGDLGEASHLGELARELGVYDAPNTAAFLKSLQATHEAAVAAKAHKSGSRGGGVARRHAALAATAPGPDNRGAAAAPAADPGSLYSAVFTACDSNHNGRMSYAEFKVRREHCARCTCAGWW